MSGHHGTQNLVISCIDYRFRARTAAWIKDNFNDTADLVAVAGASKAITDEKSREYILSLIDIGRKLHGVTTVHVLDHVDCGAYGGSSQHNGEAEEIDFHFGEVNRAVEVLKEKHPDLEVKGYLMNFDEVLSG